MLSLFCRSLGKDRELVCENKGVVNEKKKQRITLFKKKKTKVHKCYHFFKTK